jgi:hypothetical protein
MSSQCITRADIMRITGIPKGRLYPCFEDDAKKNPTADDAVAIARALGTTVEYLVDGKTSNSQGMRLLPSWADDLISDMITLSDDERIHFLKNIKRAADESRETAKQSKTAR